MGRRLSKQFMDDLQGKEGGAGLDLNCILKLVQNDSSLCLEIRDNYINIYYRGGNFMKLTEKQGIYNISFDSKYISSTNIKSKVVQITDKKAINQQDIDDWLGIAPFLKHEMDLYFGSHPKNEREFQQLMVRENNRKGIAKSTDYFIADIEYAEDDSRFDMIAIHWPSTSAERKNDSNVGLSFIEMKYGDGALTGNSGIMDHITKLQQYLSGINALEKLKKEIQCVFNQKLELGLVDNKKAIVGFNDKLPELIFVFANHDPESSILKRELQKVIANSPQLSFEIKVAVSNFMGYGLYEQNIYTLQEFINRFGKYL